MARFVLRVNGRTHEVEGEANDSLLSVLRYELNLTGSKFGCGEGHCGACTVLIDDQATRSCVARIGAVAGKAITTIDAIGTADKLHPVQQAFLDAEAFQCGYCTPGMILSATSLLHEHPRPTDQQIVDAMNGNICRCGTYPRIVAAIKRAAHLSDKRGANHAG